MATSNDTTSTPPKHHINITHILLDSFLACLLLLLVVSCGVVFRSFIIRRRVRAHVREALAAGFEVDEHGNIIGERPKPKPLGEKPVMWEVWLDEKGNVTDPQDTALSKDRFSDYWEEEKEKVHLGPWQDILPVSVKVLQPTAPPSLYSAPNPSTVSHPRQGHAHAASRGHSPPPVTTPPPAPDKLEVSVLISMPNPNRRFVHGQANNDNYTISSKGKEKSDPEEEGEVPDLLFGVTEVGIRPLMMTR